MFNLHKKINFKNKIDFLKFQKYMITFSISFIFFTIFILFFKGLNFGIDFKGGVLLEAEIQNTTISSLRSVLNEKFNDVKTSLCNSWR